MLGVDAPKYIVGLYTIRNIRQQQRPIYRTPCYDLAAALLLHHTWPSRLCNFGVYAPTVAALGALSFVTATDGASVSTYVCALLYV